MSVWGKILGGAAGFALGGPIGALIGAVAGHAVDTLRSEDDGAGAGVGVGTAVEPDHTQSIAFTIGVIALCAKMAKADGVVKRSEVEIFKRLFHVPAEELANVGRVFDLARRDATGFEPYARQIAGLFADRRAVLEDLLDGLFAIATADSTLHDAELAYLRAVAHIFGFSGADFARIHATHDPRGPAASAYGVLGVDAGATTGDIKAAHRRLVRDNHPDRLIAQGLPQEFIDVATEKVAAINAAWDHIRKERGII